MYRARSFVLLLTLVVLGMPADAAAQAVAIGPRLSFVNPDPSVGEAAERDRYKGGVLRLAMSRRAAIELAADWRSMTTDDAAVRVRENPIQASLLVFPWRSIVAPYLVGGVGWYRQTLESLADGELVGDERTSRFGYHGGFGGELQLGRRAAFFLDYRYRFIRFGNGDSDEEDGESSGLGGLFDAIGLSHEGSMWTSGLVIRF